jgi:TFIIF-interacting CTD phosphatase-like protein
MHIVLDLDETLIHTQITQLTLPTLSTLSTQPIQPTQSADFKFNISGTTYYASKRPGLTNFLNFVFGHFESVSVWTAATEEYAHIVIKNIMTKKQYESLLFVKTRNDLHKTIGKPLPILFEDIRAKNIRMRTSNTIMIDDREDVMSSNFGNGIVIPAWKGAKTDISLYQMVIVLKIILDQGFQMGNFNKVIKLTDVCN